MNFLVEHMTLLMGLFSFVGGGVAWYRAKIREDFNAERKKVHMENAIKSLSTNTAHLDEMLEERIDRLETQVIDLHNLLRLLFIQMGGDTSQIFPKERPNGPSRRFYDLPSSDSNNR
ncbi:MAG: hypothetical protein AAGL08_13875 [Cyanobacteria bacterium J06573_11]